IRSTGSRWPQSVVFAAALELLSEKSATALAAVTEKYKAYVGRVVAEGLAEAYAMKHIVDGKTAAKILGIKPGPALKGVLDRVMDWQLDHPLGSRGECEAFIKETIGADMQRYPMISVGADVGSELLVEYESELMVDESEMSVEDEPEVTVDSELSVEESELAVDESELSVEDESEVTVGSELSVEDESEISVDEYELSVEEVSEITVDSELSVEDDSELSVDDSELLVDDSELSVDDSELSVDESELLAEDEIVGVGSTQGFSSQ
ncbi:CCA tRNA nucleotidyltransferase, mitochondrial, partial [Coemansia sp. RSA 2671]